MFSPGTSIIMGCGNVLLGDDGFGPVVAQELLSRYSLPDHVQCMDAGTSIQGLLFDIILSENKPQKLIIVDAVDVPGKTPGEIFEVAIDHLPASKTTDFSPHQFPGMNMLKDIQDQTSVAVHVLAVQISCIPPAVEPGLSEPLEKAVPGMCQLVLEKVAR